MSQIVLILALFLAIFWSVFLFWRACRHEFIESEQAFDITIIGAIGAIIGSRILDFVENIDTLGLSLPKLVFFNAYGGFDFRGGILGAGFAIFLFLRHRRSRTLHIYDLAAAPILFGQFVFNLVIFLAEGWERGKFFAYVSLAYLLIFLILKRLATRKRHLGFFVCFWLVAISVVDVFGLLISGETKLLNIGAYKIPFDAIVAVCYLVFSLILWHLFSKRTFSRDAKNLFALLLLSTFRFRRMITSVDESGKFSKSIVLLPLFVSKTAFVVIKLVFREIRLGFGDFLYALGLKHDRY